jgi:hypothetical protein
MSQYLSGALSTRFPSDHCLAQLLDAAGSPSQRERAKRRPARAAKRRSGRFARRARLRA